MRGRTKLAIAVASAAVGLLGVAAVSSPMLANAATGPAAAAPTATFNVKNYGAKGDGSTNDAAAITKAVNAANAAGGGTVEFPSGTYKVGSTVHLKSNVTVQLDSGSTLTGTSSGYDAPESNPNDSYQDFGHSHFHDAMFYGDGLSNIGFTGSGTIDGGGNFITGNPSSGQADKLISLTRCTNLTMNGITLKRGGHFAILINGCNGVSSDHLNIQTASDRDGWNVINTQNATFTNITDAANDDALVFKSDWALGQRFTQKQRHGRHRAPVGAVLQRADVRLGDVQRLHATTTSRHHHHQDRQVRSGHRVDGRREHLRRALQRRDDVRYRLADHDEDRYPQTMR